MNPIEQIQQSFAYYLQITFAISDEVIQKCSFSINTDSQKQTFGDLNSNAPFILTKTLGLSPRQIAETIISQFTHEYITSIQLAGAGFLNASLSNEALQIIAQQLFHNGDSFFVTHVPELKKEHYLIEFVSANPTGPLHLGNGRGGIIGDVLGNILQFLGHVVTKEFYINDAGVQIEKLGKSFKACCQKLMGIDATIPEDGYHGEYLVDIAKELLKEHTDQQALLQKSDSFFAQYAKNHILENIKHTLTLYGIHFDSWFSEISLHKSDSINHAITLLEKNNYMYESEGALWFRSTLFGDDKDRVIRKSSGEWTYAAADIAYLQNKVERGSTHLIMVLGHDHHSYAVRLETIKQALGIRAPLDIILYQLVKMKSAGELVRMSKRTGSMVTLEDVIEAVGTDVARFFYLHRKADAQLEFDLDLALKKTEENPVYYLQYAYVRINSVLIKATENMQLIDLKISDAHYLGQAEGLLIKKMVELKTILQSISRNHQTHLLTYYALELADTFHRYYAHERIITDNIAQSRSRLLLLHTLKTTFTILFDLMGINKPERM